VHARLLGHSVLFVRPAGQNRRCFKAPSCALARSAISRPSENRSVWTRPTLFGSPECSSLYAAL